jgi:hypothetical protein
MGGLYIFLYIANSPSQLNLNIHFRLRKNKCEQDTSLPRKEQNQARSTSPFIDGSPHPAHWLSEEPHQSWNLLDFPSERKRRCLGDCPAGWHQRTWLALLPRLTTHAD